MKRKYGASSKGPSKKAKRSYNKKFTKKASRVYRSLSRKSNTLNSLVGQKHVKAGRKYIKPNPKLDRRIRIVAQKQAIKDLPIYDCKETFVGSLPNPNANAQRVQDDFSNVTASAGGVSNTRFNMLDQPEIAALILKGFGVTNSTALPIKCNIQYAKKVFTITNNTTAFFQFSVIEYVYNDDTTTTAINEWINTVTTLPTITGGATQNITQLHQRPYDLGTWKKQFKYKEIKFDLAPGASYTHALYASNLDIDFAQWNGINFKKGLTKGLMIIHNYKQVGCGTLGEDAALAAVPAAINQVTVRVDAHYKITCPETAIESESVDKWFRGCSGTTFVAPAISVFDRTAVALNANV